MSDTKKTGMDDSALKGPMERLQQSMAENLVDQPLKCEIENNRLVISIGLGTLAFAAENDDGNPNVKIASVDDLGKDVCAELEKENEIGESLLTNLFDEAVTAAFENGSVAFDHDQPVPKR